MWSTVERFLAAEGFTPEQVELIVKRARHEDLDPALIDRVIATMHPEREGAGSDRERASTLH
jgi:hypothetical protein